MKSAGVISDARFNSTSYTVGLKELKLFKQQGTLKLEKRQVAQVPVGLVQGAVEFSISKECVGILSWGTWSIQLTVGNGKKVEATIPAY